jgi:hypothetical protein
MIDLLRGGEGVLVGGPSVPLPCGRVDLGPSSRLILANQEAGFRPQKYQFYLIYEIHENNHDSYIN